MKFYQFKNIVITGAASGLGRELALVLAKSKANLFLCDINLESLSETAELVQKSGAGQVHTVKCDVQLKSDIENLKYCVEQQFNHVDLLINNAGVAGGGLFEDIPDADWEWCFNINYWSAVWTMQTFLPLLERSKQSPHILNIASAAGLLCGPQMVAYNCSKAALIALSRSAYSEFGSKGIGVSVACPTFFQSNIINNARICNAGMVNLANFWAKHALLDAHAVAVKCLQGARHRKLYIIPSWDAKILWLLNRFFPESFAGIARYMISLQKCRI